MNKKFLQFLPVIGIILLSFFIPAKADAATCTALLVGKEKCVVYKQANGSADIASTKQTLNSTFSINIGQVADAGTLCSEVCKGNANITSCKYDAQATECPISDEESVPSGYSGPIPDCAFTERGCRNVDDLLELAVNIGRYLFSIMGSVAFIMFIYGGITMVISFGNAEKYKQGQGILVAAVVGVAVSLAHI